MGSFRLYIAKRDSYALYTQFLDADSVDIGLKENFDEYANFTLKFHSNVSLDLSVGMKMSFRRDDAAETIIFRGMISNINIRMIGLRKYEVDISCVGFEPTLARYITSNKSFNNVKCGDIVKASIIALGENDIKEGVIHDGATLTKYQLDGSDIRSVIKDLAEISGFVYYVDREGFLHFKQSKTIQPAIKSKFDNTDLTNMDKKISNVDFSETTDDYYNHIIVKGSSKITGGYWTSTRSNVSEINRMKLLMGGKGIFSYLEDNSSLDSQALVDELADKLVLSKCVRKINFKFTTETDGYNIGDYIDVNVPNLGINNMRFVIESISISCYVDGEFGSAIGNRKAILRYEIDCELSSNNLIKLNKRKSAVDTFVSRIGTTKLPAELENPLPFDPSTTIVDNYNVIELSALLFDNTLGTDTIEVQTMTDTVTTNLT